MFAGASQNTPGRKMGGTEEGDLVGSEVYIGEGVGTSETEVPSVMESNAPSPELVPEGPDDEDDENNTTLIEVEIIANKNDTRAIGFHHFDTPSVASSSGVRICAC